jgi:hypothetical protein
MLEVPIAAGWILFGMLYCNALEWVIHKYVLHKLGRRKKSNWRFHWEHHGLVKKHKGEDPDYFKHGYSTKESLGIAILALTHLPIVIISPVFYFTILAHGLIYLYIHQRSHKDLSWAKKYVPWHWDHHMGPKKAIEANWCVTFPLFDIIMRTRVKYYGTKQYYLDIAKQSSKKLRKMKNE